jgi:hypothetical protein
MERVQPANVQPAKLPEACKSEEPCYGAVMRPGVQPATRCETWVDATCVAASLPSAARSRLPPAGPRTSGAAQRALEPTRSRSRSRTACAPTGCQASPTRTQEPAESISRARGSTRSPHRSSQHAWHAQSSLPEAPLACRQRRASFSPRWGSPSACARTASRASPTLRALIRPRVRSSSSDPACSFG